MDLPTTGEGEVLRDGDQNVSEEVPNVAQQAHGPATTNDTHSDGDNKFQDAISVWRGDHL